MTDDAFGGKLTERSRDLRGLITSFTDRLREAEQMLNHWATGVTERLEHDHSRRLRLIEAARKLPDDAEARFLGEQLEALEIWDEETARKLQGDAKHRVEELVRCLDELTPALSGLEEIEESLRAVTMQLDAWEDDLEDAEQRQKWRDRQKPPSDGSQARNHRRIPVRTEITLESENNFFTGFSADLSEGGVFVATGNLLTVGQEVDLELMLPGTATVRVHGLVRWVREPDPKNPSLQPGMGIEFLNLDEASLAVVSSFVGRREPLFYAD